MTAPSKHTSNSSSLSRGAPNAMTIGVTLLLAACSSPGAEPHPQRGAGGGTAGGGGSTMDAGGGGASGSDDLGFDAGVGGSAPGSGDVDAEVYAHTYDTLYKLDPETKALTAVGKLEGCDVLVDIALDKGGNIYGTTYTQLVRIDKATAKCTTIHTAEQGTYPNSLSFVPAGSVDPSTEALVGYQGATYVRIDIQTGTVKPIGALPDGYVSSGDIVSVSGGGTFVTVFGGHEPPGCDDCLFEVDPKTGGLVKDWGPVGHRQVFGLAFWGGSAYGFDDEEEMFQIDFGTSTVTTTLIGPAPSGIEFYGAGSSTSAPLAPLE